MKMCKTIFGGILKVFWVQQKWSIPLFIKIWSQFIFLYRIIHLLYCKQLKKV